MIKGPISPRDLYDHRADIIQGSACSKGRYQPGTSMITGRYHPGTSMNTGSILSGDQYDHRAEYHPGISMITGPTGVCTEESITTFVLKNPAELVILCSVGCRTADREVAAVLKLRQLYNTLSAAFQLCSINSISHMVSGNCI
jgi:hypothetical protein